jgi:hypothetical protein
MPAKRKSPTDIGNGLVIDIAGVSSTTLLSQLTVGQFATLLVQIDQQLLLLARANSASFSQVLQQIRTMKNKGAIGDSEAINDAVKQIRLAVLHKIPDMVRQTPRRRS